MWGGGRDSGARDRENGLLKYKSLPIGTLIKFVRQFYLLQIVLYGKETRI